jgi:hypothetical protein
MIWWGIVIWPIGRAKGGRYRAGRSCTMSRMSQLIAAVLTAASIAAGILLPLHLSAAAELTARPNTVRSLTLPFPRSERAHSVWASGACWTECGSYCAWGLKGCLERDAQGQCIKLTDTCDRYCQRNCRTSGGPLLTLDF